MLSYFRSSRLFSAFFIYSIATLLLIQSAVVSHQAYAQSPSANQDDLAELNQLSSDLEGELKTFEERIENLKNSIPVAEYHNNQDVDHAVELQTKDYKPYKKMADFLPVNVMVALHHSTEEKEAIMGLLKTAYNSFENNQPIETVTIEALANHILRKPHQALSRIEYLNFKYLVWHLKKDLPLSFKKWQTYLQDQRKPVKLIEILKFTNQDPETLVRLALWYKTLGYEIKVKTILPASIEKNLTQLQANFDIKNPAADRAEIDLKNIKDFNQLDASQTQHIRIDQSIKNQTMVLASFKNAYLQAKQTLGLLKGLSVSQFQVVAQNRTPFEKTLEMSAAVVTTVTIGFALHETLVHKRASGKLVNTFLPLLVLAADKMFFTYYQRPVSAFFGQGISFKIHETNATGEHSFDVNRISFLILVYLNSLIIRGLMMTATHTHINLALWSVTVLMTWALFGEAAMSSMRGLYSKAPLQLQIERFRKKFALIKPTAVFVMISLWNTLWGIIQIGDLYKWVWHLNNVGGHNIEIDLRSVLTVMAIIGLGVDSYKNRNYFKRTGRKFLEKLSGNNQNNMCELSFVMHEAKDEK